MSIDNDNKSSFFDEFFMSLNELINGTKINYLSFFVLTISILKENIFVVSIVLYLIWYVKAYLSRTILIAKEGSSIKLLAEKLSAIHSGYRPTIWCFPSLLNTLASRLVQRCIKIDYCRKILNTTDGGVIAIDWANLQAKKKLVLLVLPGLTGCSKDSYVTHLVEKAKKKDCIAVVMNYRGIEVELKTPRSYSATNLEDVHLVVNHIRETYTDHTIMAVGVSLGGIMLGGYLAKYFENCSISNAMIVSAPFNIFTYADEMEKLHNFYIFNRFFTKDVGKYFERHRNILELDKNIDCNAIAKAKCLREFDTLFVTKHFGYESCEDYYRDASLDEKIQNISVRTLFLNAGDDMFSPEKAFPIEKIKANPYTALVWTKYGGHISFCEGLLPNGCNYSCRILTEYLQQVLNEME